MGSTIPRGFIRSRLGQLVYVGTKASAPADEPERTEEHAKKAPKKAKKAKKGE